MTDKKLEAFFKELFSWSGENLGMWLLAGMMELCMIVFMFMPYQEIVASNGELMVPTLLLGIAGPMGYICPYIQFREEGKMITVYQKLKYLPISLKEIRMYRFKKLFLFCGRMFLIFLIGQLLFALLMYREITWGNIYYPLINGFVIPLGGSSVALLWIK